MLRIIGGGIAGLLAANMLRKRSPIVYEKQPELPNNHGALLRFRSPVVGEVTGIPFREVEVIKGFSHDGRVHMGEPTIPVVNRYSYKVTGRVLPRSIMNMAPSRRWIAPDDFCESLARGLDIEYGVSATGSLIREWAKNGDDIISTIPMPLMMDMFGWERPKFEWSPITSFRVRVESPEMDVYQTIYYPGPEPYYRASITGNLIIVEVLGAYTPTSLGTRVSVILEDFGLPSRRVALMSDVERVRQEFGKLKPVDDDISRRAFILRMTQDFNLYSLGRFGTWRQLLLDDLVQDIRLIDRMMTERTNYHMHL